MDRGSTDPITRMCHADVPHSSTTAGTRPIKSAVSTISTSHSHAHPPVTHLLTLLTMAGKPVADAWCRANHRGNESTGDIVIAKNVHTTSGMMGGGINKNPTADIITAITCV